MAPTLTTTSIVPSLPPSVNGVGDYAFILAENLYNQYGITTNFLVSDQQWTPSEATKEFIADYCNCDPKLFVKQLPDGGTVLLHYVNYGYQKRGCPLWLLQGLRQWKGKNPQNRLVTMFHELYAFGPPWTSSFWLSPVHRILAAQLCSLSDSAITSMQKYASKLSGWDKSKSGLIHALPVFSSIGEPSHVPNMANRKRNMVVFGGKAIRTRAYTLSLEKLKDACRMLEINAVIDVGPKLDFCIPEVGVTLFTLGMQEPKEIQRILLNSWAGYIDYPVEYLAKSTVFASYCAHGVVPVLPILGQRISDDILSEQIFISTDMSITDLTTGLLQQIANNAAEWYATHCIHNQSEIFRGKLKYC